MVTFFDHNKTFSNLKKKLGHLYKICLLCSWAPIALIRIKIGCICTYGVLCIDICN